MSAKRDKSAGFSFVINDERLGSFEFGKPVEHVLVEDSKPESEQDVSTLVEVLMNAIDLIEHSDYRIEEIVAVLLEDLKAFKGDS